MENMNYLDIANSPWMWTAAGLAVTMVLVQAFIFGRKSYTTGLKMGLTKKQMNTAIKSSAITAFGPSLVVLSAMIALLVSLGGPVAWMRLSFIGSAMFEMMAAGFGTQAMGVDLGKTPMTDIAYANAVWTMTLGGLGWIIFATLTADKMDMVQKKFSGSDTKLMGVIAAGAVLAAFGSFSAGYLIALNQGTISCITGGFIMMVLTLIADKKDLRWIREWALFFALFGGMIVASLWA